MINDPDGDSTNIREGALGKHKLIDALFWTWQEGQWLWCVKPPLPSYFSI